MLNKPVKLFVCMNGEPSNTSDVSIRIVELQKQHSTGENQAKLIQFQVLVLVSLQDKTHIHL